MKRVVIFLLTVLSIGYNGYSQPAYNNCNQALEICPNKTFALNNIDANITFCPDCEDDFNFCFPVNNSIWLTFTTNLTGGDVQIDFSSLVFESNVNQDSELQATIIEALIPCDASTYSQVGTCTFDETGNFSLNATGLSANTVYYIIVDGDKSGAGITIPAECTFDLNISGSGIDRPIPTVSISESESDICLNETVYFTANLTNCPDNSSFQWSVNGQLASTTVDPYFVTSSLLNGDVVSVKTSCFTLCPDTIQAFGPIISVYSFSIDAGEDQHINQGETVTLNASTSASDYFWTPSFLVSDIDTLTPIAFPSQTTLFSFTATENGCTLTDQVLITVGTTLKIPNTFSPNSDGLNEKWIIDGIEELYPNCYMKIYDRWGQMVFQSTGYSEEKAWDGTTKLGQAAAGVYFYLLDLRDEGKTQLKGSLTLIR